jgi:hypothetical protein
MQIEASHHLLGGFDYNPLLLQICKPRLVVGLHNRNNMNRYVADDILGLEA